MGGSPRAFILVLDLVAKDKLRSGIKRMGWRLLEKIGGILPGVHYIRDVADADSLVSSLVVFPDDHLMMRLFTPSLARKYEELYHKSGVKFVKVLAISLPLLQAGSDGRVAAVILENGSSIEADTIIIGIGAKPAIGPFERIGLNKTVGGIQVDGQFRTSVPGIFAVGDVAAFPLKTFPPFLPTCYNCIFNTYFYSKVFEYEGSPRKVWWQFYGDNVGETVEVGNFDPKIATFWIDSGNFLCLLSSSDSLNLLTLFSVNVPALDGFTELIPHISTMSYTAGKLKGVLVESGSPEEIYLLYGWKEGGEMECEFHKEFKVSLVLKP
ncbi:hypothetical protein Ancab_032713 [Ancistrocladus abbreviatus]